MPTRTLQRLALLLSLLCLSWLAQAQGPVYFYSGSLSNQTTVGADGTNRAVQFRFQAAYSDPSSSRSPVLVGAMLSIGATLDFGDGTAPEPVRLTVLSKGFSVNPSPYLVGEFTTTHFYASAGTYTAAVRGSGRLDQTPLILSTVVGVGAANDSPVASAAPFVSLFRGGPSVVTFSVPVSDPNGDTLTYSLATPAEVGSVPGRQVNPPALSVDRNTGLLSFDLASFPFSTFSAAVKVSDGQGSSIIVEQLVNVAEVLVSNASPVFTAPTPTFGQEISATVGQPVTFTVRATDSDPGDVLTLVSSGVPATGVVLTPALPVTGNPVQTTFTWTPTVANIGINGIGFIATDSRGAQANAIVQIRVGPAPANRAPVFTFAPDAPPAGTKIVVFGGVRFPVRALDPDAGDIVTLRATGLPAGATLTPSQPSGNPVEVIFSWTAPRNVPDALIPVTFTAEDSRGAQTTVSFTLEFHGSAAPVFVAPTPVDKQVFVVAPGQPVQFTVRVEDISGLFGTLNSLRAIVPLPPGASLTPTAFSGNFAETTFSWTPTLADVGTYSIPFEAADRDDSNVYTGVTIVVRAAGPACDPAAGRPVAGADQLSTSGGPLTIAPAQLLANDTDPQGRPLKVSSISALTQGRGMLVTNADGSFTFTPAPGFTGPASFTYALDLNTPVLASRTTGHYYEFVSAPGISWTQALQRAGNASYQGMRGYLATITSAAEKEFLTGRNGTNSYWFGAADDMVEGEWRWKAGPEAGQLFWRGAADGTALAYANWAPGEPNDFKNQFRPAGEDYAQLYGASGFWNDLSNGGEGANVAGYIIEYGGLEACTPVLFATGTVTIQVAPAPATAQRSAQVLAVATRGSDKATLAAFPNPSAGQFRLRVTAATDGAAQLDVYDMQGRRVKAVFAGSLRAGEARELTVDAPELATGVYLVRLQTGQQVQQLRIVVQK